MNTLQNNGAGGGKHSTEDSSGVWISGSLHKVNNKNKGLDEILWVSHRGDYITQHRVSPEITRDGAKKYIYIWVVAFRWAKYGGQVIAMRRVNRRIDCLAINSLPWQFDYRVNLSGLPWQLQSSKMSSAASSGQAKLEETNTVADKVLHCGNIRSVTFRPSHLFATLFNMDQSFIWSHSRI